MPPARRDLAAITKYAALQHGDLAHARTVAEELGAQCRKLSQLPGVLGRPRHELMPDLRSFPYQRYLIFFRYPDDSTLEIVRVIDARRDLASIFDPDGGDATS